MKLKYKARTKTGELQSGLIEAADKEAALNTLSSHDLYVISIDEIKESHWLDFITNFFGRVKSKDLMVLTRQFAALLGAKVPLADALRTLQRQTKNQILRETMGEVANDVDAGLSLSQALDRQNNVFSLFYVNMVRSAEITGRMEETISFLADYLEKETIIVNKVRNALIYPVFVIVLFFIVAIVMIIFVLPVIKPIFEESGVQLPFLTRVLLDSGDFLSTWWWAILVVVLGFGISIREYLKTPEGKIVYGETVLKLPLVSNLLKKLYLSRFAESISVLVRSGIPIAQAIEITGHTVGSIVYREALHQAAEDVRTGQLFSQALAKNEILFPPIVTQMVAIGEETGKIEELLKRISEFFGREVEELVGNLVELIQPIIMLFIGVAVALLFASILKPIYDLASTF
ncbi:MAG: hypothetical protein A3I31_01905 [Candidatus Colwellbacteria bacterium RIFCSPLOWO2_02_FULL_44_20b]|uniref:Type II secretion system protein GspF domain-containing protein n=1 Tax=Candidatus Colwellbacteria bacterium RIFCSPLOWO2_02_FULL_44_20b TaxID=1797691 RepID=A0A1G1Z5J7_9BACT|nr:MAG: hypothetical protein A3I31_01905 [Candidatus Colwellbacteria bacterium RIFCSPLOWO2_02_FULL_44_20b]